jgi:hypothetical protein
MFFKAFFWGNWIVEFDVDSDGTGSGIAVFNDVVGAGIAVTTVWIYDDGSFNSGVGVGLLMLLSSKMCPHFKLSNRWIPELVDSLKQIEQIFKGIN